MSGTTCKGSFPRVVIVLEACWIPTSSPSSDESSISCVVKVWIEKSFKHNIKI